MGGREGGDGGRQAEIHGRFRIIKEVGLEAFYREQMAERGRMGVREEVKSRQAQLESRGEEKGRGRKKLGKQMN